VTDTPTGLVTQTLKAIQNARPQNGFAVVLIGSAARDTATSASDLDLLVLASPRIDIPHTADRLHVQSMDEGDFVARLRSGDDFAAWCVRFGVPLATSEFWVNLVKSTEATQWPDWRQKIPHALRRLTLAHSLCESKDLDAATEEALYAATHVGRAILLKNQQFPLSRPEMIQQLRESGCKSLGNLLKTLLYDEPTWSTVRRANRYVKRLLIHLDREQYEAFVRDRRQKRAKKLKAHTKAGRKAVTAR
jgi:predicted nucleotidyltransferase